MTCLYFALQPEGTILQAQQLAEILNIPRAFLFKIVRKLVQHDILESHRSRQRGYSLSRPPQELRVSEIVEAIEGPDVFKRCLFWDKRCSDEDPCLFHDLWLQCQEPFYSKFTRVTLQELLDMKPSPFQKKLQEVKHD